MENEEVRSEELTETAADGQPAAQDEREASVQDDTAPEASVQDEASGAQKKVSGIPAAILGSIVGLLAGVIPNAIFSYLTGSPAYFLFIVPPVAMTLFIILFKGARGKTGVIITSVFSLISVYVSMVTCLAGIYCAQYGMSMLSIPVIAVLYSNSFQLITEFTFSSAYVFPILFAAVGVFVTSPLFFAKQTPAGQE